MNINNIPSGDNNVKMQEPALDPINNSTTAARKKPRTALRVLRAAVVSMLILTLLCGVLYPVSLTLAAQAMFPYEANGSQIIVTMPDGTRRAYGSELIGQQFESPKYLIGRVNTGAPSNLSPESEEFQALLKERMDKLIAMGYSPDNIPDQLLTQGGSGIDPHISPDAAEYQVDVIAAARSADAVSAEDVRAVIKKYTEGRFLGLFGEKRVNVLLVNLALDGLI